VSGFSAIQGLACSVRASFQLLWGHGCTVKNIPVWTVFVVQVGEDRCRCNKNTEFEGKSLAA